MTDVLIRDVADADLLAIDREAERLGVSRGEFLRWVTRNVARRSAPQATREDLLRSTNLARDLLDEEIMDEAW